MIFWLPFPIMILFCVHRGFLSVYREDLDLWAQVLSEENANRKLLVDQVRCKDFFYGENKRQALLL